MRLRRLDISDFRNLGRVELHPSEHASVFVGPNGQGKTNLLEAVFFLCTLKPLRASRLAELVRFGAPLAKVGGRFLLQGAEREIAVEVSPSPAARRAFVDHKRAPSLDAYFGGVAVVAFTPDDLAVVKGGPDGRRAFLDRAVFNRFPAYLEETRQYTKALKSRNRLLKDGAPAQYLEAYDEAVARLGARLFVRRRALLEELLPRVERAFEAIGRASQRAAFTYAPAHLELEFAAADEESLRHELLAKLRARLSRDLDRGFTSVGPHADDLEVSLSARAARAFASQGQQRALVLAWKVAEIENLRDALGFVPLLLLDDVSSELDPERNAYLMQYLAESRAQVFLTTTDAALVRKAALTDARWFSVRAGEVAEASS